MGALYMFFLAYHVIRSGPVDENSDKGSIYTFGFGFMIQFLNIKAILFGVSVYLLFIIEFYKSLWMILLFAIFLAFNTFVATSVRELAEISCGIFGKNTTGS